MSERVLPNSAAVVTEVADDHLGATRWSMVWEAGHATTRTMRVALERLCQCYWPPVYAYIRQTGKNETDAEDLTQAFFAHLLEKRWFSKLDPSKGRLRAFLFGSLKFFLTSNFRKETTQKRGGNVVHLSLDEAEERYQHLAMDTDSPDVLFQRHWARQLVERALQTAEKEAVAGGKVTLWNALVDRVLADESEDDLTLVELGKQFHCDGQTMRRHLFQFRKSFRRALCIEVGATISSEDPEEIQQEMRVLFESL
jgi:RNA polymerase sigma factor (sigma-70 family)